MIFILLLVITAGVSGAENNSQSVLRSQENESHSTYDDESGFSFIYDLYDRVSVESNDGNVLLSPFSVASVLALTLEGARGDTASQMLRVLHWNTLDTPGVRESIRDALSSMNRATRSYVLAVANRVFLQNGYDVLPNFRHNLRRYHLSDVQSLDFSRADSATKAINSWAARATRNRISELMSSGSVDRQTRLLLMNAVYFKGDWTTQFDAERTQLRPFFPTPTNEISTPMMYTQAEFGYAQLDDLQSSLLELPYRGRHLAMYLLLPDAPDGLDKMRRDLLRYPQIFYSPESFIVPQNVTVLLPKFRLEQNVRLKPVLAHMGIRDLFFQGKCDLSAISNTKDLFVSDVVHKSYLEVNEKGTKAAAVSAITIRGRMMQSETIFRADHPFMFFIQDKVTKTVLFIGHVKNLVDSAENESTTTTSTTKTASKKPIS
uniref:Serpin domain-containing protein n=1 Tax=Strigamia maritima TaxID=126957 RepID=T1IPY1_STRMM